jgi:hypothetical protein
MMLFDLVRDEMIAVDPKPPKRKDEKEGGNDAEKLFHDLLDRGEES